MNEQVIGSKYAHLKNNLKVTISLPLLHWESKDQSLIKVQGRYSLICDASIKEN